MAMPSAAIMPPKPDKLRALGIMALNGMFDELDGVGVLRQAATELLSGELAVVSSFGADLCVLLHMVAQVDPDAAGVLPRDGQALPRRRCTRRADARAASRPHQCAGCVPTRRTSSASIPMATCGRPIRTCCHIRKTEPLDAEIAQYGGWVTGRKRS